MRLKTEFWVKAYVRRCAAEGVPAMIVRHGDDDAGAVFVKVARLDGSADVFAPAPAGLEQVALDRAFVAVFPKGAVPERDADAYLARQVEFDSDVWLVEIEDRQGRHFLDDWLASTSR